MQRSHRKAHALIWTAISLALPICLAILLLAGPNLSSDAPAIRLDAPEGAKP